MGDVLGVNLKRGKVGAKAHSGPPHLQIEQGRRQSGKNEGPK